MRTYCDILKRANLSDDNIVGAFSYGSRVYGNITPKSDSLFETYKEKYNNLLTEFRKVAPK